MKDYQDINNGNKFFSKVEKTDTCWNWKAAISKTTGYAVMKYNGKAREAHRLSYLYHFGDIEHGIDVCHKCDNRKCVNPDHLFLGTRKDNMQDCKTKGRLYAQTDIGRKEKAEALRALSMKKLSYNGVIYNSMKECFEDVGISRGGLKRRIQSKSGKHVIFFI
jgi:hypothetical protein